jgi:hypothetical protein
MIEFVVTLVAVLVLLAALLQIGQLGILHSKTLHDARERAGGDSLLPDPSYAGPDYIADWTPGPDGVAYSRDDRSRSGLAGGFEAGVVQPAHPQILAELRPANPISPLAGNPFPQLNFGLIQARVTATNATLPVVRRLIYAADPIEVEGQAWATWTKGIY